MYNSDNLGNASAGFIEEMYIKYSESPESVSDDWRQYFDSVSESAEDVRRSVKGASWTPSVAKPAAGGAESRKQEGYVVNPELGVKAYNLVNAYRQYGHMKVELDPLGINPAFGHEDLELGVSESDLDAEVNLGGMLGIDSVKLKDLKRLLESTYSSRIGAEFMHIKSASERAWIEGELLACRSDFGLSQDERLRALKDLIEAEAFENYLHVKFPGTKRFSVEGLEGSIVASNVLIAESVKYGATEFVMGMAHRGRLNTLTKVMGKPYHAMFSEFKGELAYPEEMNIPGDVKYHLGASCDLKIGDKEVHISLVPNPSHLEAVNPVVLGKVRARQDLMGDSTRQKVVGILVHGDAAFAGQGSVMEALSLGQLKGYHTGGTIHIVANNQIGFTTNAEDSRATTYCTDIAKFIEAPVFHVNGDDAEAVVFACKLAAQYRAKFKKDVVVDVVGYRKYGHNEGDEPLFTQPKMYAVIKGKANPAEVYARSIVERGILNAGDVELMKQSFKDKLDAEFEKSKTYKVEKADWLGGLWSVMEAPQSVREEPVTGVDIKTLNRIGEVLSAVPEGFNLNPKIMRQLEVRQQMFASGVGIDWATGEALALATLLEEGYPVRMTGQDVERGTFSHRHAVFTDQETQQKYCAMNNLSGEQKAYLEIKNSNLSELGVMGFEYGYSFTHPKALTIWEGQFGDFANGAQVMIDQYIASAEMKWLRMSGLVLLLPHGYEGQGPEHSSARLERFLQLCASDNMQVANPTTPASLFHLIRRQMHRNFRKPLIIMSPKSLLRHKLAVSSIQDFASGTKPNLVIGEVDKHDPKKIKKVILCSGKVYYDLYEKRKELGRSDIAIMRIEQLYPFPAFVTAEGLAKYPNASVVWCQEEHENMGAYMFIQQRLDRVLENIGHKCKRVTYAGRPASASPAVGYMKLHTKEHAQVMEQVFDN